jgi:hypothetical protein
VSRLRHGLGSPCAFLTDLSILGIGDLSRIQFTKLAWADELLI